MVKFKNSLLETNVNSRHIAEDILIYGSCIDKEYPEILDKFEQETALHICLEAEHVNKVAWKILSIVRHKKPKEMTALTIDGSPHCVQLHYALEDVKKMFPDLTVNHYVIEKGKVCWVRNEAVRNSRHLSKVRV